MRVIVCGDRNWSDRAKIKQRLERLLDEVDDFITVIEGEAKGADSLGRDVAEELGIKVEKFPAQWEVYGRGAGPVRNGAMLNSGVDLVLAFHEDLDHSRGTLNMVKQALEREVEVEVIS